MQAYCKPSFFVKDKFNSGCGNSKHKKVQWIDTQMLTVNGDYHTWFVVGVSKIKSGTTSLIQEFCKHSIVYSLSLPRVFIIIQYKILVIKLNWLLNFLLFQLVIVMYFFRIFFKYLVIVSCWQCPINLLSHTCMFQHLLPVWNFIEKLDFTNTSMFSYQNHCLEIFLPCSCQTAINMLNVNP